MAPLALGAVYLGGLVFLALLSLAAWLMGREWSRLVDQGRLGRSSLLLSLVTTGLLLMRTVDVPHAVVTGATVAAAGALFLYARIGRMPAPASYAAGVLAIALPLLALDWLRLLPMQGLAMVLWLLGIVWATDIGAYAFGRTIGGPRLAPRISPNKTWAGLLGGMACAAVVGGFAALWIEGIGPVAAVTVSAALAVISQIGDLAESRMKRRFGVKDTGGLIPGHGGLLDRTDGLLAAAPVFALLVLGSRGLVG